MIKNNLNWERFNFTSFILFILLKIEENIFLLTIRIKSPKS